jgi:hypothetical protein
MSLLGMPLTVINLGGEMMYILEQRLIAQKIPPEKACKVTYLHPFPALACLRCVSCATC